MSQYLAFLLRLRRDGQSTPWRATIENPHTGERRSFTRLVKFILFLEEQTGEQFITVLERKDKGGEIDHGF